MYGNNYYSDHNISIAYISERMRDVEKEAEARRLLNQAAEEEPKPEEKSIKKFLDYPRIILAPLINLRSIQQN